MLEAWKAIEHANGVEQTSRFVSVALYLTVTEASKAIGNWLSIPPWIVYAILSGCVAWFLRTPERRQKAGTHLATAARYSNASQTAGRAAVDVLAQEALRAEDALTIVQAMAAVLANERAGDGLLARDILKKVKDEGHHFGVDTRYVLKTLRELPCFVAVPPHHWQLGEVLGAPSDAMIQTIAKQWHEWRRQQQGRQPQGRQGDLRPGAAGGSRAGAEGAT